MTTPIKSTAGHVLATGEATEAEVKALAAYALGDADNQRVTEPPVKSFADLQRILSKIEGQEGQHERADMVREQMAVLGG